MKCERCHGRVSYTYKKGRVVVNYYSKLKKKYLSKKYHWSCFKKICKDVDLR